MVSVGGLLRSWLRSRNRKWRPELSCGTPRLVEIPKSQLRQGRSCCEGTAVPPVLKTDNPITGLHLQHISYMAWRSKLPMLSPCPGSLLPCRGRPCPMIGSAAPKMHTQHRSLMQPGSADSPSLLQQSQGIIQHSLPAPFPRFFVAPRAFPFLHHHPKHGHHRCSSPITAKVTNMDPSSATCVPAIRLDGQSPAAEHEDRL